MRKGAFGGAFRCRKGVEQHGMPRVIVMSVRVELAQVSFGRATLRTLPLRVEHEVAFAGDFNEYVGLHLAGGPVISTP